MLFFSLDFFAIKNYREMLHKHIENAKNLIKHFYNLPSFTASVHFNLSSSKKKRNK